MSPLKFKIEKKLKNGLGRAGVLTTPHGDIKTPAFVTVGTKATIKALSPEQVKDFGAQVVLANTYHLYLEPGNKTIKKAGGIHTFMNWNGPIMADSGGFQAFSLGADFGKKIGKISASRNNAELTQTVAEENNGLQEEPTMAKIDEDGVTFKSYIDGSEHKFTAERSIEIQHNIGADMIFAFDECTSPLASHEYQKEAMSRTHRWAIRSLKKHKELLLRKSALSPHGSALFGIVQGGRFQDLRVESGSDLFDCVAPTRIARNGSLYTNNGRINIFNTQFRNDFTPVDINCVCYTCTNYTRAYIAHLFRSKEMFAATLASIHNLYFTVHLVDKIRQSILDVNFEKFKDSFLADYYANKNAIDK